MSEHGGNPADAHDGEIDTGPPGCISEPQASPATSQPTPNSSRAQSPSSGFLGGVRRSIQRRIFVSQAADLSWNGPLLVLLEYLKALFELIKPTDTKES